jgi:spoIIIJ-associated protein
MSESREFFAATVEEALDKASSALGVSRDRLSFEVLDQGSAGFLGIGTRDARILVRPSEEPHLEAQVELGSQAPEAVVGELPETSQPLQESSPAADRDVSYELIVAVDEFTTGLIDAMGFDATVDVYDAGDTIAVDVATKETGLFIGQKGETIDSIQYLLNAAVYKDRPFVKRIIVDSEGYRQRRVEAIQGMAHRIARRAVREQRPLSLPPMSAAERRVVHLFLKENPGVTTFSEGEEEERRVVVSPS